MGRGNARIFAGTSISLSAIVVKASKSINYDG